MFTSPKVNVVVSDTGFSVRVVGRGTIEYKDDRGTYLVDGEILAGGHAIAIYPRRIEAAAGEQYSLSSEEKNEVIENIKNALKFKKLQVDLIPID